DQDAEIAFLKKHYRQMPRTMLRYAIEKFDPPLREQFLKGLA
ncbi:MAG: DNA alkylation repair protein, partial [Dethiobacteria bacterium]